MFSHPSPYLATHLLQYLTVLNLQNWLFMASGVGNTEEILKLVNTEASKTFFQQYKDITMLSYSSPKNIIL
jgi:hypothetical protein